MRYNCDLRTNYQKARYWTGLAIHCWQRGCKCDGCLYYKAYFEKSAEKCHMKATVLELVRTVGIPTEREIESKTL